MPDAESGYEGRFLSILCRHMLGFCIRHLHMLRSKSESDHPSGNSAKEWNQFQQPDWKWRRKPVAIGKSAPDDTILNRELHSLRHAGRPLAPLLDQLESLDCKSPCTEWRGQ